MKLRLGTRGSQLALVQAEMARAALAARGIEAELVTIRTTGDVKSDTPIDRIGGIGAFVKELDDAVREGRVDAAVHSLKDIPTIGREGLPVAAVLPRDAAGDVLVGADSLDALPAGARIGTSSLRRRAQVLHLRKDLEIVPLRGNVPTRLAKVEARELDAVLLSRGGLVRLGLGVGAALDPREFPHAPGQGVVALVAAEGSDAARAVAAVDDPATRVACEVERLVMSRLGGGCLAPLGVYAEASEDFVLVFAQVLDPDGRESIAEHAALPRPMALTLASIFAGQLAAAGATRLLSEARR